MSTCHGCGQPVEQPTKGRRKWCSERCRKQQYSVPCEDCGAPVNGSDGRGAHRWCLACSGKRGGERQQRRWLQHRVMIEAMWADGYTFRQICNAVGLTYNATYVSNLRARGYDLPHRRTPEQLERITADRGAHLAKARAVYREMREARA